MAKKSDFTLDGGFVLKCKKCPSQFNLAGTMELEFVLEKVRAHEHAHEMAGGAISQSAIADNGSNVTQAGGSVHNSVTGTVHGGVVQAGSVGNPGPRRSGSRADGYLW